MLPSSLMTKVMVLTIAHMPCVTRNLSYCCSPSTPAIRFLKMLCSFHFRVLAYAVSSALLTSTSPMNPSALSRTQLQCAFLGSWGLDF